MSTRGVYAETARSVVGAIINASTTATAEAERARLSAEEQLRAVQLAFAEVSAELYEAAQMQRKMCGPRLLHRGDFEIAAEIFPMRHLSGDFFNLSEVGDTALLAIGDVAGKGVMAGMWFTHLLGLTRILGESFADPAEAMVAINRQLCASASAPPLTTMFLSRLDWKTGELVYCNAGHPAPALLRASGKVEFLTAGGIVLGVVAGANYGSTRVVLERGDTLLGFSDGVLECANENDEQFGVERVIHEARTALAESPTLASRTWSAASSGLLFSIIGAAQDFAGTLSRTDDCSMMVIRRAGSPSEQA